jgi:hypothetical protein
LVERCEGVVHLLYVVVVVAVVWEVSGD